MGNRSHVPERPVVTAPMKPSLVLSTILACGVSIVALACGVAAPAAGAPRSVEVEATPLAPAPVAAPAAPAPPRAAASPVATSDCIDVDAEHGGQHTTLEGVLVVDTKYEHPSRGKTRPFILRLSAPRCALGTAEPRVAEIHLASGEGVSLKPLVGRRIRVAGEPFAAQTAWHARDVVLMTTSATAL